MFIDKIIHFPPKADQPQAEKIELRKSGIINIMNSYD